MKLIHVVKTVNNNVYMVLHYIRVHSYKGIVQLQVSHIVQYHISDFVTHHEISFA